VIYLSTSNLSNYSALPKFTKKQSVSEIKEGDKVDDIFFVKFKKGMVSYSKGFSFELVLSDNSGRNIDYKYWGGHDEAKVKATYNSIKADSIVRVQGRVSTFNNKLQLATNEPFVIEVLKEGQYDDNDFIRPSRRNLEHLYEDLLAAVDEVSDEKIKELLNKFFRDPEFSAKFKKHPGAIEIHHNWVGGLMQHTMEVLKYCKTSGEMFSALNKDLLIAGALLHDIGKTEELAVTSRIRGTNKGQLLGHIMIGSVLISAKCDEVGMEPEMREKILHIILSHHGKMEYGSPKEPMFPEAMVVYYSDELSSKLSEIMDFVDAGRADTEDDFMYHKRNGRNILLK